jgi:hypothetical protein
MTKNIVISKLYMQLSRELNKNMIILIMYMACAACSLMYNNKAFDFTQV